MNAAEGNGVSLQDRLKKEAGISAVDFIESGMVLGLGTGTTVRYALEEIGKRYKEGRLKDIVGIPSSIDTDKRAKELGIPIITFDEKQELITIKHIAAKHKNFICLPSIIYSYIHQSPTSQAGQGLLYPPLPKSALNSEASIPSTSVSQSKSPLQGVLSVQGSL